MVLRLYSCCLEIDKPQNINEFDLMKMVKTNINLFAEGEVVYTDGGVLAEFAWVLVVLPFIAALIILLQERAFH